LKERVFKGCACPMGVSDLERDDTVEGRLNRCGVEKTREWIGWAWNPNVIEAPTVVTPKGQKR
jgi:hypothetical protein